MKILLLKVYLSKDNINRMDKNYHLWGKIKLFIRIYNKINGIMLIQIQIYLDLLAKSKAH